MDKYDQEVIKPGDAISKLAKDINVASYRNCLAIHVVPHEPGNFRGPVSVLWRRQLLLEMLQHWEDQNGELANWTLAAGPENDGAGGKPQFHALLGLPEEFRGLGWEIIAMTADDLARSGRMPNYMASNELQFKGVNERNFHLAQAVLEGFGEGLSQSRLASITGETAIMQNSITAFCDTGDPGQLILTWGGTCVGLTRREQLLSPKNLKPGLAVVGFYEPRGYRCNGGGFFTDLIRAKFGSDPRALVANPEVREFVKKLTPPSTSYARTLSRLNGWLPNGDLGKRLVRLVVCAHITGGGVWGKFAELMKQGRVGAVLDHMPETPEVLRTGVEWSQDFPELAKSDWQAYKTLHGGCGMLVVVAAADADKVVAEAGQDGIEASIVGETVKSAECEVIVHSRFLKQGRELSSLRPE